jgi:hypothetical protein
MNFVDAGVDFLLFLGDIGLRTIVAPTIIVTP